MNIVHVTDTNTAYMPAMFVHIINQYTKHKTSLLQQKPFLFGNPLGIENPKTVPEITHILESADVLHFHGSVVFDSRKFLGIKLDQYLARKKFILHYHGTPQREKYLQFRRAVPLLVSTPEMLPLFPGSRYFPNLIDEKNPIYSKCAWKSGGKLKICHHFSYHRAAKNTNEFLSASQNKELQKKYEFVFLERMDLDKAIKARAQCDLVFDHLQGYYGLISMEGMTQGLGVVNGCSQDTFSHLKSFLGDQPPFIVCPKDIGLEKFLMELSRDVIFQAQRAGMKFMREIWSAEKNIGKLIEIYERI